MYSDENGPCIPVQSGPFLGSGLLLICNLQLDNNLIENAIRPVALRCKNFLFAGPHDTAQNAAMIYSLFATCKKHEVNPQEMVNRSTLKTQ